MSFKELLIQELDDVPDALLVEVLDFLRFLKTKQEEDHEDVVDARAALANIETEGTETWENLKAEVGVREF